MLQIEFKMRWGSSHFHEDVLAHVHHSGIGTGGNMIVVHQILGKPGTLGLPVGPDAHGAVVDVVPAESVSYVMQCWSDLCKQSSE